MSEDEFNTLINEVLLKGIQVTLSLDKEGNRWYDMDTGMKSHLQISYQDEECLYSGRYDVKGVIEDTRDLLFVIKGCMCGRDYANSSWIDWLVDESILKKTVTTATTYTYE